MDKKAEHEEYFVWLADTLRSKLALLHVYGSKCVHMNSKAFSKSLLKILTKCIILISRGTSQDNKMAAFRESYGKLYELRSLASDIPVIALTATATPLTRDTIVNILHMEHFVEIKESPNKTNLRYVVHCMDKKAEHEEYFVWLADTLREKQNSVRTIVYCQTIKQCSILYATISGLLGKENMINENGSPSVKMLHSCTPEAKKNSILESSARTWGR